MREERGSGRQRKNPGAKEGAETTSERDKSEGRNEGYISECKIKGRHIEKEKSASEIKWNAG